MNNVFNKKFFSICAVLVLQNVITLSVNLSDNMMLGAYSESALAGVAAVNQIQFVYQQLLVGLGDGLVIFCSQYWGKKQTKPIKKIVAVAMCSAVGLAITFFIVVTLFPNQTMQIFTNDRVIIGEGVKYLNIIRFTYLFFAITQMLLASMRSVQVVKIAMYLSIMTFCVNCGINYVLIYGHFGAPEMGAEGAAIGTLIARIIECGILSVYVFKYEKNLKLKPCDCFHVERELSKAYYKVTSPILLTQGLWGVNTALQTVILGHMTSAAIAANSVSSTLFLLMKSLAVGAASTAGIIIGEAIGAGNIELVKKYSIHMQKLFVLIGFVAGIVLFFIRIPILALYQLSPETKSMANQFLLVLCVVVVGMTYQMPTHNGIIRGGGNAKFVMKMDIISIWGIMLPLSFFMAFVVKASPVLVVCCLNSDQIFKCIPAYLESHYGNWIRKLTDK